MLKVYQDGIKDTEVDEFYEFEDLSKEGFENIIETLEHTVALTQLDLDDVIARMKRRFPPTTDKKKSPDYNTCLNEIKTTRSNMVYWKKFRRLI